MAVSYDQLPTELGFNDEPVVEDIPEAYSPPIENPLLEYLDDGNLVSKLQDNEKSSQKIITLYDEAKKSMDKWLKKYKRAINLAKLQAMAGDNEIDEKSFPFEGASLSMLPFVLEGMLDFSSRAAPELVWSPDIVKAKIYGEESDEKKKRSKRVSEYSNYQLTELIPQWRDNQDKGIMALSCVGTFYKETYFDSDIQEIRSELCLGDEVIFNHKCKSFELAPDKFKNCTYTRNEVIGFIRGNQKWEIDEEDLEEDKNNFDFIKGYTWLDIDDDGLKEPYIVMIFKETSKIVSLYPDFDEDTITYNDDEEIIKIDSLNCFTQYKFLPDPECGPMGMGWGILLGPMFESINTSLRQLIDSGTLQNTSANSGLISQSFASGRGNAVNSAPIEIALGQLTPVEHRGSGPLRDSIVQFPFAGPSHVLFQLMEYLVNSSRAMTNSALNVEASAGEAASLYLAKLQQGLKVPNTIIMRVYECAKKEFQKIAKLNYKHYDNDKYSRVLDGRFSMQKDFDPRDCDIRMTADPSQGSDIERIQRAQTIYEMAKDPQQPGQVLNYRESVIGVLEAMNEPNVESLAPEPDPNQKDPMQELMVAQAMAEMEVTQGNLDLRRQELELKKMKMAMDSAKEQVSLGLMNDKQEAEIFKAYATGLKSLSDAGLSANMQTVQQIEDRFIGDSKVNSQQSEPPIDGATIGEDGQWYANIDGQRYRVEQ